MPASSLIVVLAAAVAMASQSHRPALASMLQSGMQLLYGSDDPRPTPWMIDSVVREVRVGDMGGCVRIRLRINPPQFPSQLRLHCSDAGTMYNGDSLTGTVRRARPLGAGTVVDVAQANGDRVQFVASEPIMERIRVERGSSADSVDVRVIPTVVTTYDSTGRALRRLRERFSIELATATGGIFEVADSTQPGGWRVSRKFDLAAIRYP